MSDMTPSRPGQVNGSGDVDALFLEVFSGEVLTAFTEATTTMGRHMVRQIANGKAAMFPATWKGTAEYHTPGAQILGDQILSNERVITIDDLLIAPRGISLIDEAKSQYDFRAPYTADMGTAIAYTLDRNVYQVIALAARATATVSGANGGSRIIGAGIGTTVATLEAACFSAAQALDEKDVPDGGQRYLALAPAQYYLLVNGSEKSINSLYNPAANGGFPQGTVYQIAGLNIVKTNHLPRTHITTGPTAYQGNFSSNVGLAWHQSAVGTTKLIDVQSEGEWLIEYQTTLMLAKTAVGHGILRPEAAVELCSSATS